MTTQGVRAWVLVALHLHLRCAVGAIAFPHEGLPRRAKEGNPTATASVSAQEKLDRIFHLKESLRKPPSPPHKQAPQFMVDLFNSVSKSAGTPLCQKDILKGNIVRSFEDKGRPTL